ncbi:hypothetical protein LPY66_08450 [Dehalobacter sp. DCM]|uniref:hypothetical protein n=1 Tax=Dehalobacter sp. DCM TaxID=2907827 RepID=UPI003081DD61|nr:hypothetical protein LPY66_08450 [Dehalobacter sp. DCM]
MNDIFRYRRDPQKLAEIYHDNAEEFEKLKKKYPKWKEIISNYDPDILSKLEAMGVPVNN